MVVFPWRPAQALDQCTSQHAPYLKLRICFTHLLTCCLLLSALLLSCLSARPPNPMPRPPASLPDLLARRLPSPLSTHSRALPIYRLPQYLLLTVTFPVAGAFYFAAPKTTLLGTFGYAYGEARISHAREEFLPTRPHLPCWWHFV